MKRGTMTFLKVVKHLVKDSDMIEIWEGGQMIGGLYVSPGRKIRVISKYQMTVTVDNKEPRTRVSTIAFAED
jgi:hypothetical protein